MKRTSAALSARGNSQIISQVTEKDEFKLEIMTCVGRVRKHALFHSSKVRSKFGLTKKAAIKKSPMTSSVCTTLICSLRQ